ncbi:EAL domain-containing response regulator [Neptunomonas qingdaonensis]|uniref:cyclic-guanylate-specific phosphodiesterase n=1 Tax=Neptunomonas qingdaonensis TaxID=1045558 RepID=A0A1I2RF52_9GAMM|nr:EAL domain-containing protein [Neptunomonas qingdaonensis]SFG38683.1 diguanylate cyclase (GGDEF) domain-containing protein [Neptunomonas qingdaonensis]
MQHTLLLVDDETAILNALKRVLRRSGYQILTAESGVEALQVLEDNPEIQVVLTDYRMPGMTGGEMLAEVQQRFPHVIGLILSGYADLDAVIKALNSGAVYKFLTKPWDEKEVLGALSSAFSHSALKLQPAVTPSAVDQLLSRSVLIRQLNQWMENGIETTALYLDVKNFNSYNDSLGYEVADKLLALISEKLMLSKPKDSFLGQMSGDEFALIIPFSASEEENQGLIKALLQPFDDLITLDGRELHIAFNVGYGTSDVDGNTSEMLLRNTQVAVSYSKRLGGVNFHRYQPAMNQITEKQMTLQSDLYRALERNQFSVVYQPKVCMSTGYIVGAECLLRWKHDSLGMISPAIFIPLAESSGLIEPIGEWVLSMACHQSQFWRKEGLPPFLMSVNLSGRQLQRNTLATKVKNIIEIAGICPDQLELEITETFLMQDIDSSLQLFNEIKALGVRLAIDDFGTGYSSLSYLNRLPVNTLKIDRSFIKDLPESKEKVGLVKNMIQMSHDLDMSVVAEGVETREQLDTLKHLHCDEIQGYFYSPPVSAEQFRTLLVNQPLPGKNYSYSGMSI